MAPACGDDDGGGSGGSSGGPQTTTDPTNGTTAPTTDSSTSTTDPATTDADSSGTTDPGTTGSTGPGTGESTGPSGSSSGSSSSGGEEAVATADIISTSGSTATGTAAFFQEGDQMRLEITIAGASPAGLHGVHIHETGDCSAGDGGSAGGHWNPDGAQHGPFESGHRGDLGNIEIDGDGNGTLSITTTMAQWAAGTGDDADVIGRAIILHEFEDDLSTSPNPGPRIGCGEVGAP